MVTVLGFHQQNGTYVNLDTQFLHVFAFDCTLRIFVSINPSSWQAPGVQGMKNMFNEHAVVFIVKGDPYNTNGKFLLKDPPYMIEDTSYPWIATKENSSMFA